ncbi:hypothetical protein BDZ45DRAFT_745271 [Acephala macrosclerotiorum]|nr:hypothetical protein BDZ45DRAFT_745271 [Acephala macrosclerotiorum]
MREIEIDEERYRFPDPNSGTNTSDEELLDWFSISSLPASQWTGRESIFQLSSLPGVVWHHDAKATVKRSLEVQMSYEIASLSWQAESPLFQGDRITKLENSKSEPFWTRHQAPTWYQFEERHESGPNDQA